MRGRSQWGNKKKEGENFSPSSRKALQLQRKICKTKNPIKRVQESPATLHRVHVGREEEKGVCVRVHLTNIQKSKILVLYSSERIKDPEISVAAAFRLLSPKMPFLTLPTFRNFLRDSSKIELSSTLETHGVSEARVYVERFIRYRTGRHHSAEVQLYDEFMVRFLNGMQCSSLWFIATMSRLVAELEPNSPRFNPSEHWRQIFFKRFRISFQQVTRKQPLPLSDRMEIIVAFYKQIRWVCSSPYLTDFRMAVHNDSYKWGRFPLDVRHHADEVPLDFQKVLCSTAAPVGAQAVHLRKPKVHLEHRVASLMLCFTAEGRERICKPAICFPLVPEELAGCKNPLMPSGSKTKGEFIELRKLFPDILIYVQRNGYFDSVTCLQWLDDTLVDFRKSCDHLLVMDNLGAHTNPDFRKRAWEHKPRVWLLYTPPDCTDACAVTDDGLGQAYKRMMRKYFVDHFGANVERWQSGGEQGFTAADRRKLYCEWLCKAHRVFYEWDERREQTGHNTVRKAFQRCGLANSITGSDDGLIRISGWDKPIIL